jgi:dihydrofolate reductase
MPNFVYIATSLDGYIAPPDGSLDWLDEVPNPDDDDFGFCEFIEGIDAIVMGRISYESILGFDWPYTKPVYVLSSRPIEVPEAIVEKAIPTTDSIEVLLPKLKELGHTNLYIDGGKVIQSFLEKDLIDELIITKIPILLGGGTPLFGNLKDFIRFTHKKTTVYNDALVKSSYTRSR